MDREEFSIRMSASRLGLDPCEVRAKRQAGYRWCSAHRAWESADDFPVYPSGRRAYCRAASNDAAKARKQRRRAKAGVS